MLPVHHQISQTTSFFGVAAEGRLSRAGFSRKCNSRSNYFRGGEEGRKGRGFEVDPRPLWRRKRRKRRRKGFSLT